MNLAIVGCGYVGLSSGICFSEMGNNVICVDINQEKIKKLNKAENFIYEPGLENMLKHNLNEKRLQFTTNIEFAINNSEIIFITVGTPSDKNGKTLLTYFNSVIEEISQFMESYKVIVVKSTVPIGTINKNKKKITQILLKRKKNISFDIISNPEFLKEGSAINDFLKPDRIIIGSDSEHAKKLMHRLYSPFVKKNYRIIDMDIISAEMTKYAANSMLATKISFMNELARLSNKLGGDIEKIRQGIGSDQRIGYHFLYSGLGYGGSCLPKDIKSFIHTGKKMNESMEILTAVDKVNNEQRNYYIHLIKNYYNNNLKNLTFAIWGLSFKPGTNDIREAPSIDIIKTLLKNGANIQAYDPVAIKTVQKIFPSNSKCHFNKNQYKSLINADALCLITDWKSFREPDFNKMKKIMNKAVIFDGKNQYNLKHMNDYGFKYISIGRPSNI